MSALIRSFQGSPKPPREASSKPLCQRQIYFLESFNAFLYNGSVPGYSCFKTAPSDALPWVSNPGEFREASIE